MTSVSFEVKLSRRYLAGVFWEAASEALAVLGLSCSPHAWAIVLWHWLLIRTGRLP